ncbi:protein transport protein Sec16A-like [Spodoptera litura]|uniref:Protein transport protein Sec16A-like n=1 Tax=Spodoptera litura TaxID=69820 RepID=A0A9J7ISB5_SPOLT|nr:protein transport protein Sec16A-like [Spodoptera litura]
MPGSRRADSAAHDEEPDTEPAKTPSNKKQEDKPKAEGGKDGKASKGGWLGGILTKLSLRPPNQMILPDDKNPTIVWDAETKRWRNLDGDSEDSAPPPPPPRDPPRGQPPGPPSGPPPGPQSVLLPRTMTYCSLTRTTRRSSEVASVYSGQRHSMSTSPPPPAAGAPPSVPVSNIFKMQKGRHIKKSYVDVLNPGGAAPGAGPAPAPAVLGPSVPLQPPPSYFVPAPLPQSGVYEAPAAEAERDPYEHSGI